MKTWFITGVSSGFGLLMARKLAAAGHRVYGTVRDPDFPRDTFGDGTRIELACLDLVDTARIRPVVDAAWAKMESIDVVVNNAGYGLLGAAEEFSDTQVRHQLDTNLLGSILVIRAALPHMRAQGGGRILQVSSVAGQTASPGGSLYHATKWGIEGFVEAVAKEVAVFGIGCTIVEPGGARTDFRSRSAVMGDINPAYDVSPSRMVNQVIKDEAIKSPGDPGKMVDAMIASVEQDPAPLRLVLGSDSHAMMSQALSERLDTVRGQRDEAVSTDHTD